MTKAKFTCTCTCRWAKSQSKMYNVHVHVHCTLTLYTYVHNHNYTVHVPSFTPITLLPTLDTASVGVNPGTSGPSVSKVLRY